MWTHGLCVILKARESCHVRLPLGMTRGERTSRSPDARNALYAAKNAGPGLCEDVRHGRRNR